jgi:hypothetical protein
MLRYDKTILIISTKDKKVPVPCATAAPRAAAAIPRAAAAVLRATVAAVLRAAATAARPVAIVVGCWLSS